ncbi:hypothetical protein RB195_024997 [Necator americanus]|uniref:Uncharacterized protein n=1 Tax=Necator americanus TaxID=51031 RepID=A0ABR1EQI4_NECAM
MPRAFVSMSDTSPALDHNVLSRTVSPVRAGGRRTGCGALHSRLCPRKRKRGGPPFNHSNTHVAPESADFPDEYRRTKAAISRYRQGQFIFGHVRSLRRVLFWGRVVGKASSLNAIVPAADLPRYFENE